MKFHGVDQNFSFKNPQIWIDDDAMLNYTFTIELDKPQSLIGNHTLAFVDSSYYIAFEQELDIKLPPESNCQTDLVESDDYQSIWVWFTQRFIH